MTLKNTLHTLYKVSCQGLIITNISLCIYTSDMLNKKQPGFKKCEANQKQHCSYSYKQPKLCYQDNPFIYLNDIPYFTAE